MLRVCIASIQNVERILLLLVVSASDIPLHTIKFFSVLFCSLYQSMLQALTNKHSMVRRGLCDLHCMVVGNCFLSLRSLHVQQSIDSHQPVVHGRLCHILSFVVGKCFGTSHVQQSSIASYQTRIAISAYTPPAFDAPVRGGGFLSEFRHPVWFGKTTMVWLPGGEKISKICLFVLT